MNDQLYPYFKEIFSKLQCGLKCRIIWILINLVPEAATWGVLCKKVFLEISQNSRKNTCIRVSFLNKAAGFRTLAQVFSCEFCEISKNIFYRTPLDDCFCSSFICRTSFKYFEQQPRFDDHSNCGTSTWQQLSFEQLMFVA